MTPAIRSFLAFLFLWYAAYFAAAAAFAGWFLRLAAGDRVRPRERGH